MGGITRGRRRLVQLSVVAAIGLGASAFVMADGRASTDPEQSVLPSERSQPVRVTEVALQPLRRETTYTGTVRPRYASSLGFRIDGKMTERFAEVGQRIKAGQPLARLDESDIRLSIAALEADLAAARSDHARLEDEVARNRTLFGEGHVSKSTLDAVVTQRDQARAAAESKERSLDQTRNQLAYTTLTFDHDGVVTGLLAEAGQVLEAGTPVLTVVRTDALDAVIALPEQRRDGLEGLTATATLWDSDAPPYALTLREVSPDVDPASRTYTARFTVTAPDAVLSLGRTLTVHLAPRDADPVAAIPLSALLNTGKGSMVWKLSPDGSRVEAQPVEVDALTDDLAIIRAGLAGGERIVSLGVHKIDPGRPVRVIEDTDPPALD